MLGLRLVFNRDISVKDYTKYLPITTIKTLNPNHYNVTCILTFTAFQLRLYHDRMECFRYSYFTQTSDIV